MLYTKNKHIIFSNNTEKIHHAYKLQEYMMDFVDTAFEDADILIYMVELGETAVKNERFFRKLQSAEVPILLLINKIDLGNQEKLNEQVELWQKQIPNAEIYPVSELKNFGTSQIFNRILELLPESPAYYPKDALTDKSERSEERRVGKEGRQTSR